MRAAQKDKFLCRVQEIMIERRPKMRILYFFMVVCLVLTFGCAAMKPQRDVLQDNIFYSSTSPRIKIKIHPDFKYIGKAEQQIYKEYIEKTGGSLQEKESYLFGHIEDNRILKGVSIKIYTVQKGYWLPDLFAWAKNKLDSGVMRLQGKNYQYVVFRLSRPFIKYERDFISDKGYIIPNCFLVKGLGRIVSADAKTMMYIYYAEDIRHIDGNKYKCRDWVNKNMLTNEQQELLKGFIDRSEKNIQILGKKEVTVSPEVKESPKRATKEIAPPATPIDMVQPTEEVPRLSAYDCNTQGLSYNRRGMYDSAITEFKKALQVNPNYSPAYNNLGNAYRNKNMYDDALAAYQNALEINPNYDLAYANLGRLYRIQGKYEDATSALEQAIKLNPSRAYTHNQLCWTLKEIGKTRKAVKACKRAIAVDPSYKWAYRNLGILYEETGRLEDAISALKKALELDPNYLSARYVLARIYQRQGRTDEAKELLRIIEGPKMR